MCIYIVMRRNNLCSRNKFFDIGSNNNSNLPCPTITNHVPCVFFVPYFHYNIGFKLFVDNFIHSLYNVLCLN